MELLYLSVLVIVLIIIAVLVTRKIIQHAIKPLYSTAEILKGILEHAPFLVTIQDKNGKLLQSSKSYQKLLSEHHLVHPLSVSTINQSSNKQSSQNQSSKNYSSKKLSFFKDGEVIEKIIELNGADDPVKVRTMSFPISCDEDGSPDLLCCLAEDVTKKIVTEQKLKSSQIQLQMVLQGASLGFWDWNYKTDGYHVDQLWQDQLGLGSSDLESSISDWKTRVHPDDKQFAIKVIEKSIIDKQSYSIEFRMRHKSGKWIWIQGSGAVVDWDEEGKPLRLCGTHQDISDRKKSEADLLFLANYDNLTHLPSRSLFKEELHFCINQKKREQSQLALYFIDLDNFKIVNDTYGHDYGDLLLINVVARIKSILREEDILARFGGDEFILMINSFSDIDALSLVADKIIEILKEPILVKEQSLQVGASIGISVYPDDGDDYNLLLRNADTAMYKAKDAGRNQYYFYAEQMNDEILEHQDIALRLKNALETQRNDELFLVYQPQIEVSTGKIIGCEALLRWHDAENGFISPAKFIPIAETSNLIIRLGEWIFEQACQQREVLKTMGINDFRIDVNLSSRQFTDKNIVNTINLMMDKYRLTADDIGLELTESVLIDGDSHSMTAIHQLRKMGFKIAIDDFGTGYSSLSYIKQFPITSIKIDRAFIIDAPDKSDDSAIVRAILAMAKALGLVVIAEGVETEAQYQFLRDNKCQLIQGYYFYKPMSADELQTLLKQKNL